MLRRREELYALVPSAPCIRNSCASIKLESLKTFYYSHLRRGAPIKQISSIRTSKVGWLWGDAVRMSLTSIECLNGTDSNNHALYRLGAEVLARSGVHRAFSRRNRDQWPIGFKWAANWF